MRCIAINALYEGPISAAVIVTKAMNKIPTNIIPLEDTDLLGDGYDEDAHSGDEAELEFLVEGGGGGDKVAAAEEEDRYTSDEDS